MTTIDHLLGFSPRRGQPEFNAPAPNHARFVRRPRSRPARTRHRRGLPTAAGRAARGGHHGRALPPLRVAHPGIFRIRADFRAVVLRPDRILHHALALAGAGRGARRGPRGVARFAGVPRAPSAAHSPAPLSVPPHRRAARPRRGPCQPRMASGLSLQFPRGAGRLLAGSHRALVVAVRAGAILSALAGGHPAHAAAVVPAGPGRRGGRRLRLPPRMCARRHQSGHPLDHGLRFSRLLRHRGVCRLARPGQARHGHYNRPATLVSNPSPPPGGTARRCAAPDS
jgi:hypothetical protein